MLVLTRKRTESVVVGRAESPERLITITVLDVAGGKVRLGFAANPDVRICRSELLQCTPDGGLGESRAGERLARAET